MKIKIKGNEIELKYGFRAMMIYEEITGETFGFYSKVGIAETITMFYSVCLASDSEFPLTYNEFIEWCDNNVEAFQEFCKWFTVVNSEKVKKDDSITEDKKNNEKLKKA